MASVITRTPLSSVLVSIFLRGLLGGVIAEERRGLLLFSHLPAARGADRLRFVPVDGESGEDFR
jgi:hypothetical protein